MNPEVPPADDLTEEWWAATRDHRLLVQECSVCGERQHPPRSVCVACGAAASVPGVEVSGRAVVDTWTEVLRAPRPEVEVPYVVARVRLDEGPILLTQLFGPTPWQLDETVVLAWHDLPDGRALPVFRRPDQQPDQQPDQPPDH